MAGKMPAPQEQLWGGQESPPRAVVEWAGKPAQTQWQARCLPHKSSCGVGRKARPDTMAGKMPAPQEEKTGSPMDEFGNTVRLRRRQEGLSQQELAEKVGISRNYLSQIERGQATNLSWQVMEKLTSVLGLKGDATGIIEEMADIPPSLAEFATAAGLPPDDVQMLARLKYRGQQPTTPEKWELLYNVIKMTVGK